MTTTILSACGDVSGGERVLSDMSTEDGAVAASFPTTASEGLTPTTTASEGLTPTTTASEGFTGEIYLVDERVLGTSWQADCPVPTEDLRLLTVTHHDLVGDRQVGEIVVHADHAEALLTVFEALYGAGFPIERMDPITAFDGDDGASMRANNTSGFNCRVIDGTNRWSQHAYGTAVDINPLINPWVRGSAVDPPEGAVYLDREADTPGLIHADDIVVQAFEAIGWSWGGYWNDSIDYQHFSANGT
ncbi:MAG: M15 family metallopeptidase [Acidimicrobiales bacterium]|nr:M15 family metallopeptidase [Acidimicrobiales bacterium]MDG2216614.1 M15 family metallopeptidase [Acidimicrobiales bacterium]